MSGANKRTKAKANVGRPCHYCRRAMLSGAGVDYVDVERRNLVATIEHITPQGAGGTNDPYNITIACARCNNLRGSIPYDVFVKFARYVIKPYPNAPTTYLRQALQQFILSLAEVGVRNKEVANRALSLSLLSVSELINRP